MKIEGIFQGMDPVQTGVSKAGNNWQKTYFEIITNEGERSRRVAFCAFGSTVEQVKAVPKGANVEVRFSAESTDYVDKNNRKRYDTELRCYGLAVITRQSMQPQYMPSQPAAPQYMPGQPAAPQYQQYQPAQPQTPPSGYPPAPPARATAPANPEPQVSSAPAGPVQAQMNGGLPPKDMGFPY